MHDATTREGILDAAERLFAAQGFPATTIKQISHAAGVNSALLYYYFEDKERLYHSVLERLVANLVSRTLDRLKADASPSDRIRGFIEAQVDTFMAHPQLPRLFMREMLDHDAAHAVQQIQRLAATSFKGLCDAIAEGQKQGTFRPDLDPKFAAISTVGQVAYFLLARPAVRILLATDKDIPRETVLKFARHAADFTLSALSAKSAAASKSSRGRTS
jgi:TetR/AcrR family transcriptional regulator